MTDNKKYAFFINIVFFDSCSQSLIKVGCGGRKVYCLSINMMNDGMIDR